MTEIEKEKLIYKKIHSLYSLEERMLSDNSGIDISRVRHQYHRDYARLIYSSAFRRLQGKMQLLGIDATNYYRNRLTHSLEVAQIARSICINLSRRYRRKFWSFSDLFLIETISLAHDIGNPPFGHAGESVLDELADDFGGFEGNAQTYRIIRRTERKYRDIEGLNLSKRTMLGVVKYHQRRKEKVNLFLSKKNTKFLYDEDFDEVREIKEKFSILEQKTIDCQVMDLADEIAYGAHDLEDSLHQRFINAYDLKYLFKKELVQPSILKDFTSAEVDLATSTFSDLVDSSLEYAYGCLKGDSDDVFETVFRKELSSKIVDLLVNDIDYQESSDSLEFIKLGALSEGLKKLLFNAIKNDSEKILIYERVGKKVITGLYEVYTDDSFNRGNALLSSSFRSFKTKEERKRKVIDYISGMMDSYAVESFKKLRGEDPFKSVY